MTKIELGRYHRFVLEFLLIVAGVLAALAVDDWRQSRANVATERYILEGILVDLERDRVDIERVMSAANARAAGADKLLTEVHGAAVGGRQLSPWVPDPNQLNDENRILEMARLQHPPRSLALTSALRLLTSAYSIQRVDVSAATFTEASASGEMDRIQDRELRAELAQYYYSAARTGSTTDQRVYDQWLHLQNVLASRGLPSSVHRSDEDILRIIQGDDALIADILNAREHAVIQIIDTTRIMDSANELTVSIREALQRD